MLTIGSLLLGANSVIAVCYFAISFLIFQGHRRGQEHLLKNPLVLATVIIFLTCAVSHAVRVVGGVVDERFAQLTMQVQVVADLLTASIAVIYFALRRQYSLLVDDPLWLAQTQSQLAQAIVELAQAKGNLENAVAERTTELLHVNQQLDELLGREQKARQEVTELLESISDAFFALNNDWQFTYINPQAEKLLRRSPEELLNRYIWSEFPTTLGTIFEREYRRAATEQVAVRFEEFFAPLDKWLGVRVYPTANGLSVYLQDISDRKQEPALLQQLNLNLEQRVAERTAQLEATNKELEAFSYSVSHDLRAPLRSIDGFSLALLERCTNLDEKGKHYLQRIRAASQRMGELIEDLLHLSRVTRSEMQFQTVDLSVIVNKIASELQQVQPERLVEFAIAPDITAQADPQLIRVLFENLLDNAWKFTSHNKPARIEFGKLSPKQLKFLTERPLSPFYSSEVYFISDNGAGFDMAYAARLFVAFQRLHSEDEFPGNGIGLATVKRIVLRHGGQIWAESVLDKGTTFFFTLQDRNW